MYSSGVLCYRMRASHYLSFGESPYGNRPSWRSPCSSCCSCCCANSGRCGRDAAYELGLGTWLFYGLRQSALICSSGLRKVVLASGNGYDGGWYSECDLDGEILGSYGGVSLGGWREGRDGARRRKVKFVVLGEERGGDWFSRIESVDAVIRLLTEEVSEESVGWKERDGISRDRTQIRKKRRKSSGSGTSKSEWRCKVESIGINATDRDGMEERVRGREVFDRRENRGARREGSRCSSYHSFLSSGDYEDDVEEEKRNEFSVEALGRYGEDSRKAMERKMKKEILEDYEQHEEKEKRGEVLRQTRESESSFVDWDRRKKSEKKLSEFSSNEVESSQKSMQELSSTSRTAGREDVGPSSSRVQFHGDEQKSSVGITVDAGTENLHKHKETKHCRFCGSDVKLLSQTERQPHIRRKEDIVVSGINEPEGKKGVATEREKFVRNPYELSVELDIRGTNSEINTKSSRSSRTRLNSAVVEEKQRERFGMKEMVHREEQSGKSEQLSEYQDSHYGIQRISLPQPEDTKNSQKESKFASNLTENRIVQSPRRHPEIQTGKHSGEESSAVINQSIVDTADTRLFSSYQRISNETTVNNNNFTSVVILAGEAQERNNQTGGSMASVEPKIGQHSVDKPSSPGDTISKTSASQDFDLIRRSRARNTDRRGSKTPSLSELIPPPSQLVQRESSPFGRTDGRASQEGHYVHNSDTLTNYEGAGNASLHYGFDSREVKYRRDGQPVVLTTGGDALESAMRSDEASWQFLGEFLEQTKHVASSDFRVSDAALDGEGRFDGKTSSGEIVSENSQVEVREKRDPAEGPGKKDPSDDIWHDTDTPIQEIPKSESPEGLTESGNIVVKRSGGNLWRIIGDLFRLRWGSAPSAVRSGGRNSSNVSVRSGTWFSGHEAEENIDIDAKRGSKNMPPEAADKQLQPVRTGDWVDAQLSDRDQPLKAEISPPSMTQHDLASSSIKGITWNKDNAGNPPVAAGLLESSLSWPEKGMTASVGVISSSVEVNVYGSELLRGSDESSNMSAEASASDDKNEELKHRKKLQRKQQFPRDRFDEWEKAYQLECEQRQIDEMFMREALLEAKKAGDNWEVPVGAVLVEHGKIIARGCNLVDELRDSTAHAEMVCIREASNVLKSWRLAETTLYVTLEPCTMCAGAILQARVDSLVWGAPNKLLGADGSYVRLFPVEEGDSGSRSTDKPAPPVHPFHPKMTIRRGVLASECADTMQEFFQMRRRKKEKKDEPGQAPGERTLHSSTFSCRENDLPTAWLTHDVSDHIIACFQTATLQPLLLLGYEPRSGPRTFFAHSVYLLAIDSDELPVIRF